MHCIDPEAVPTALRPCGFAVYTVSDVPKPNEPSPVIIPWLPKNIHELLPKAKFDPIVANSTPLVGVVLLMVRCTPVEVLKVPREYWPAPNVPAVYISYISFSSTVVNDTLAAERFVDNSITLSMENVLVVDSQAAIAMALVLVGTPVKE